MEDEEGGKVGGACRKAREKVRGVQEECWPTQEEEGGGVQTAVLKVQGLYSACHLQQKQMMKMKLGVGGGGGGGGGGVGSRPLF